MQRMLQPFGKIETQVITVRVKNNVDNADRLNQDKFDNNFFQKCWALLHIFSG